MTIIGKCVLASGIVIATFFLGSNLLAKKYNEGLSNLMSIVACLFILFSHSPADSLCMMGVEETTSSEEKALITGPRKTDSGDHDQLGTVEMQLSHQEKRAEELECKTEECQKAASFSHACAVGSGLASIPTSPVSKGLAGVAIAVEELSTSYSESAADASRGLEITKETISALKDMKSS
jgi:hypothetical protein